MGAGVYNFNSSQKNYFDRPVQLLASTGLPLGICAHVVRMYLRASAASAVSLGLTNMNGGISHWGQDYFGVDSEVYKLFSENADYWVDIRSINSGGVDSGTIVAAPDGVLKLHIGADAMYDMAKIASRFYYDIQIIPMIRPENTDALIEFSDRIDSLRLRNDGPNGEGILLIDDVNGPTFEKILPGGLIQIVNHTEGQETNPVPEADTMYYMVTAVTPKQLTLDRPWETETTYVAPSTYGHVDAKMNYIGPPVQALPVETICPRNHGTGIEKITNGDFLTDTTGWTVGADWSRDETKKCAKFTTGGTSTDLVWTATLGLVVGKRYHVKFYAHDGAETPAAIAGTIVVNLGGDSFTIGTGGDETSVNVDRIVTCTKVGDDTFSIEGVSTDPTYYIDGISIREVPDYGTLTIDNNNGNGECVITATRGIFQMPITIGGVADTLFAVGDKVCISNSEECDAGYSWDGIYKITALSDSVMTISPTPLNGGDASALDKLVLTRVDTNLAQTKLSGYISVPQIMTKGEREAWE